MQTALMSLAIGASLVFSACSSSSTTPAADAGGVVCASPGGAVSGAADTHCGTTVQPTSLASCHPDAGAALDAAVAADAAMPMDDGGMPELGATLFNAEGDDDDCKFHLKWTATPVCSGAGGVTFTVTATKKTDGSPLTGAAPYIEALLTDTHPAPSAGSAVEGAAGSYVIGPVKFDAAGTWTVRFHFYGDCADGVPDSPHAHAAFFVRVP